MVNEAEKYKEEDEKQKERIVSKNALESYAFNLKSTVEDDKVKDKISDDDKATILKKAKEVLDWLDHNQVSCCYAGRAMRQGLESGRVASCSYHRKACFMMLLPLSAFERG